MTQRPSLHTTYIYISVYLRVPFLHHSSQTLLAGFLVFETFATGLVATPSAGTLVIVDHYADIDQAWTHVEGVTFPCPPALPKILQDCGGTRDSPVLSDWTISLTTLDLRRFNSLLLNYGHIIVDFFSLWLR